MGRHVMIEVGEGIISWMNPSGPHEDIGHASDKVVEAAGDVLSILVKAKRGTRWKGPEDSKKLAWKLMLHSILVTMPNDGLKLEKRIEGS